MNMEKEFAPYEEALELKELGFNEPCFGYYIELRNPSEGILTIDKCENNINGVLAPTFSQVLRWFREIHQLPSWVYTSNNKEWWYSVLKNGSSIVRDYKPFQSYDEAQLACLRKLIKIVKNG